MSGVPEINPGDPGVLFDPFAAYASARRRCPVAHFKLPAPDPFWVLTEHAGARALLTDPGFRLSAGSYFARPAVPAEYLPYLRTMGEMDGPEHQRLRRLVSPAFSARRAEAFRARVQTLVAGLLDDLEAGAAGGHVDLISAFARPLPMDVICELVGIPTPDRARWRTYGGAISAGDGRVFAEVLPGVVDDARAAVARRREESADDLLTDLIRVQAVDGDRLSDTELVTLVWHLVLAGQTPTNFIANAVEALLTHPDQLAALRADPALMPRAVDELLRWAGPNHLSVPRFATADTEIGGCPIRAGEPVSAGLTAGNRDPAAFPDPDRLDLRRATGATAHLAFGHGPHHCLGAAIAKVQSEVALAGLFARYPALALAPAPKAPLRAPDPGTWRLTALPVTLGEARR